MDAVTWHREVARNYERAQQWQAALFHWNVLIERDPSRPDWHDRRGRARAELGLWKEAAADFETATKLGADRPEWWHRDALARLHLGDVEGYRRACTAMIDHFAAPKDVGVIQILAWTCTLATIAEADRARLLKIAEPAMTDCPPNYTRLVTLGAALFRAGRYEDAIVKLNEAGKRSESGARDWLFLAMAYHHKAQPDQAKTTLERASRSIDQTMGKTPGSASDKSKLSWSQRLELSLLQREATALLRDAAP
jgi:tetratricopeptide (TPR) repeat protein